MRSSFFATLAGMLAMAGVSIFQPVELHAGTPLTGGCDGASCLSQAVESKSGKLDQAASPQMLAFEINIKFKCPDGFRREDGECVRDRRGKKKRFECSDGFHREDGECVRDRKSKKQTRNCPEGTEFSRGKCRRSEFPPVEGEEEQTCSHNDHLENGRCVPCRQGFHVEGDECVPD
ncbi:hypothetical protein [Taklimakanibacter albus]|uniref:Uncharacterized protein n=1 Tax=Taklimakanibacter albus TaxID=2800327 RepID=A0ACC5R7S1_9HYPH|nr:hypothetical protein [Aestuariivirga sp. YIM B02566]MBK1868622.1 hypothetical protein [Aestuariivirga sp. YIM B02566]